MFRQAIVHWIKPVMNVYSVAKEQKKSSYQKISTSNDRIIVKAALLCEHLGQKNYTREFEHITLEHHPENIS